MDDFSRRQASIKSVLTCGICKKLCKDVTIIDECCHRFCKKCITRKFTEEKLKVCPECNLDLGVAPWQKLRPDHSVQGIRDILSAKRRECIERGLIKDKLKKAEPKKLAHEDIDINTSAMLIDDPPVPPPPPPAAVATSSRRKEKSISSLVDTTPSVVDDQVQNQQNVSTSTGRRGRRRGSLRNSANAGFLVQDESSKFNNVVDLNKEYVQPESPTIPFLSGKATQDTEQVENSTVYAAESSKKDKSREPLEGMNDLWAPLNILVTEDVSLDNSSNKSNSKEPVPKFITPILINLDADAENEDEDDGDEEDEEYVPSPKIKEPKDREQHVQKSSVVLASAAPSSSNTNNDKGKGKKGRRRGRKKKETHHVPVPAGGSNINVAQVQATTEVAADTSSGTRVQPKERVHPIWFTLVASDKQDCPSPLPQLPTRYIKIKDPNKPSSYIKKYLAIKLNLQSEDEVEVRILGMPIRPALPMQHLVHLWLRTAPDSEKKVKIGASAQEFVIVLKYGRSQIKASP